MAATFTAAYKLVIIVKNFHGSGVDYFQHYFDKKPEMSSMFVRDNPSFQSWLSVSSAFWSQREVL